ncbi:hypothetical protein CDD83_5212 [Cordyceps sp. RAO-2017]|nr:hypothetical protein CDD83_5212 [Cordyceps sp. RAO-2017]
MVPEEGPDEQATGSRTRTKSQGRLASFYNRIDIYTHTYVDPPTERRAEYTDICPSALRSANQTSPVTARPPGTVTTQPTEPSSSRRCSASIAERHLQQGRPLPRNVDAPHPARPGADIGPAKAPNIGCALPGRDRPRVARVRRPHRRFRIAHRQSPRFSDGRRASVGAGWHVEEREGIQTQSVYMPRAYLEQA